MFGFVVDLACRAPNARGNLEPGDLDERLGALYKVGDRPGTPWTDPNAHGSAFMRIYYFYLGYLNGAPACAKLRSGPI